MSCCGKSRQALKASRISVTAAEEPRAAAVPRVVYRGQTSILFRGPVSGRGYWFTPEQPGQDVDPRDLGAIVETGLFARS